MDQSISSLTYFELYFCLELGNSHYLVIVLWIHEDVLHFFAQHLLLKVQQNVHLLIFFVQLISEKKVFLGIRSRQKKVISFLILMKKRKRRLHREVKGLRMDKKPSIDHAILPNSIIEKDIALQISFNSRQTLVLEILLQLFPISQSLRFYLQFLIDIFHIFCRNRCTSLPKFTQRHLLLRTGNYNRSVKNSRELLLTATFVVSPQEQITLPF